MKKTIALALTVMMVLFCLAGCKEDPAKQLYGSWSGEISMDLSQDMSALGELGVDMSDVETTLPMAVTFTFNQDGTYSMSLDREKVEAAMNNFMTSMLDKVVEALYIQFEAQGVTKEQVDALMQEQYNTDLAGFAQQSLGEAIDYDAVFSEADGEGHFAVEDGVLYTWEEDETDREGMTYTLNGDNLTFESSDDAETAEQLVFPFTLTKVK